MAVLVAVAEEEEEIPLELEAELPLILAGMEQVGQAGARVGPEVRILAREVGEHHTSPTAVQPLEEMVVLGLL
jgi:hypothetical protein